MAKRELKKEKKKKKKAKSISREDAHLILVYE